MKIRNTSYSYPTKIQYKPSPTKTLRLHFMELQENKSDRQIK